MAKVRSRKKVKRADSGNRPGDGLKKGRGTQSTQIGLPVVGIGASAGGIEAIRGVLGELPATLGMAIVIVVHLDRKLPSRLVEVLSKVSALPVEEATDGRTIEPNRVYVIPPNKQLSVSCGMLQVLPRGERTFEPINCFFTSLAREHGEQCAGVVLSGTGKDGAAGVKEIKARGGITFTQEAQTAIQTAMPLAALETGSVDFVLAPEDIGKELVVLAKAMSDRTGSGDTPVVKSEAKLRESLLSLLQATTQVDFVNYKQSTIWRRVNRRIAIKRIAGLRDYVDYCRANPDEVGALYQDILINVTSFFRDPEVFESLERKAFPAILKARSEDTVRIWVPGCSTGEEAYSLAIAVLEFISANRISAAVQIFGTDINDNVIERARAGIYTSRIVETVSAERLGRFFVKVNQGYQVTKTVRDMCVFARQNIVADPPLSKMDLISCRNLLIYLGPTLQRKVIPRLHYALKPESYLLLGKSEVIDIFADLFSTVDKRTKLYCKKPASLGGVDLGSGPLTNPLGATKKAAPPAGVFVELETQREIDRLIATRYSPPVIAINESLDILQVRGDIKPFLDMGSGLWNGNLARLVQHDFARRVRELVARAVSGKGGTATVEGVRLRANGSVRLVDLRFISLRTAGDRDRRFMLILEPAHSKRETKGRAGGAEGKNKALSGENLRLEEELKLTREHLQSTIDEREIRNEELQAANEEILSNNEELQTMNQELETSKEELESSNEELATLNEELQMHLEQLRQSEERFRILVSGVREYAIFMLDPAGVILSWNEGAQRINGYRAEEVIGKSFSMFYPPEAAGNGRLHRELEIAAREGTFSEEAIRVRKDGTRFWANVVITPLLDERGEVTGYAKVTRDVTERKLADEKLRLSEERFRILISGVKDYAIFMMDPDGNILNWNEGAERLKGYRADEIVGKNFSTFYTAADRARKHSEEELAIAKRTGRYEEEGVRVRKDGSTFIAHIIITALRDAEGNLRGFGKVTRDVTEQRNADELLRVAHAQLEKRVAEATETVRKQEAQIRLITNALPTLVAYIQPDGRYSFNNDAYERWFGRPAAEFTGERVSAALGPHAFATLKPHLDRAFAGEVTYFEHKMGYAVGPSRYVHATYIPDIDRGAVRGVITLVEDITERKRHEQQLSEYAANLEKVNKELSASNSELSQFAHVASHDLKEPLRMIKVYTQLIESKYVSTLDEKGKQFMTFVVEGAARMEALINDLLAYSAVGRADAPLAEAQMSRAATVAMSNLRETIKEADAEIIADELPTILGSESQLTQLLQNLIGNAIKFRRAPSPTVRIRSAERETEWEFRVEDNGIGIAPQYLERIFVIFQRLHDRAEYPGTGIGLAICKRVVERHGGRIWVESIPGEGSSFCFTIPKSKEKADVTDR